MAKKIESKIASVLKDVPDLVDLLIKEAPKLDWKADLFESKTEMGIYHITVWAAVVPTADKDQISYCQLIISERNKITNQITLASTDFSKDKIERLYKLAMKYSK